jgi:hypothetical protein
VSVDPMVTGMSGVMVEYVKGDSCCNIRSKDSCNTLSGGVIKKGAANILTDVLLVEALGGWACSGTSKAAHSLRKVRRLCTHPLYEKMEAQWIQHNGSLTSNNPFQS